MYKKNYFYNKMLILILLPMSMIHSFNLSQFGKICATALLAAGAAAVGADWFMNPTDEQLINRVKQNCDLIVTNNKEYVSLFKKILGWHTYSSSVRYQVMNTFSENFLYEIARLVDMRYGKPFPTVVVQDCAILEKDLKLLLQRIDDTQSQQFLTENQRYNLSTMRMLVEQVTGLQEELCLLKDYILKHTSYFSLAECGWSVNKKYSVDFELCDIYNFDQYSLLQKLDALIYKKYNYSTFAYISYVEDLESAINRLLYARRSAAFNYGGMISWVDQCLEKLKCIRTVVEHRYQLQMLERERLHNADRIAIF